MSVSKEAEVLHHGGGFEGGYKIIRFINWVDKYMTPVNSLKNVLSTTASSKGCSDAMQTLKMWALENLFNISLAVLRGNMKQILGSDWLPHFACLRLPALFPCMKNVAWSRLTMVVTFGQCGQWSCKKQQKTIKTKTYTTRSPGFIVLQTQLPYFVALQLNKSFLILDKEKSFCYKIYLLLTKLV